MKHALVLVVIPLLALGLAVAPIAVRCLPAQGPLMTVAAVQEQLAAEPRQWVGRIVRVRAIAYGCWVFGGPGNARCRLWRPGLIDEVGQAAPALPLTWVASQGWLWSLRSLPLLGELAPTPQAIRWDTPGVYRIQLRIPQRLRSAGPTSFEAVVLDAVPPGAGC